MRGGDYAMSHRFNADEIFEMALQIERNGADFYRRMAEHFSDIPTRKLFLGFAEMEDRHEKAFTSLRADLSDQEREPTVFDPEGETTLYLQALAGLRVFDEKAEEGFGLSEGLSGEERVKKIFLTAIGLEKESIVFYLGMKDLVPANLGKSRIDDIIKEEMNHLRILGNKLASLKA